MAFPVDVVCEFGGFGKPWFHAVLMLCEPILFCSQYFTFVYNNFPVDGVCYKTSPLIQALGTSPNKQQWKETSMTNTKFRIRQILLTVITKVITIAAIIVSMTSIVNADTWRGTAPFCNGACNPGETQIATSSCGDGACCWTGHKALCRNSAPTCAALQTKTACYGIIMVCDNGHYVGGNAPSWVSCSKYVCGMCFGFSW